MDGNNDFLLQLILGTIVLIPPIWTIWKSYYDKFKIAVILQNIHMGIHEWDEGNRFEIQFFVPMEIINISNSMGLVTNMRLKLIYQIKGHLHYFEFATGDFELISQDKKKFDFNVRGDSLFDIIKSDTISFPLKPQQRYNKHILFRTFWRNLRLVNDFQVILEIQLNNRRWKKYGEWIGHLYQQDYDLYIANGSPIPLTKDSKHNRIMQKWKEHMVKKIDKKYGTDVKMRKISLPPSNSKW
ncbi:MAG: hypothetical protein HDQ97_12205 [Lachnospiraceae bacterium]|nr:hypothetical protein [Lachnospiraceae bacterium]